MIKCNNHDVYVNVYWINLSDMIHDFHNSLGILAFAKFLSWLNPKTYLKKKGDDLLMDKRVCTSFEKF
jgi:hypothetical protein